MRNNLRTLVIGGALLATASIANAQTTLLDSLGAGLNVGNTGLGGPVIGYDPGVTSAQAANTPSSNITLSGYVAIPFTLTGSTNYSLSSVAYEGSYFQAKDPNFNTAGPSGNAPSSAQLYGAIVVANSVTSGSLNGATPIGGFFTLTNVNGTLVNNKANDIFTGTPNAGTNLTAGQSYFLVVAPINKFGTQTADGGNVLEYATVGAYTLTTTGVRALPGGTASINSGIATEAPLLSEKLGANPNDSLTKPTFTGLTGTAYSAVKLEGIAGVPESSTLLTALLGLVPVGGLMLRRRRAN